MRLLAGNDSLILERKNGIHLDFSKEDYIV